MKPTRIALAVAALSAATTLALLNLGCTLDSANEVIRDVSINYSGFYEGQLSDGKLVSHNQGGFIRTLKLIQQGDQIDAIDSNGAHWSGELEDPNNGVASFVIRGNDSLGNAATISGILTLGGGSSGTNGTTSATDATMRGNYFQGSIVSVVNGKASAVPGQNDNGGGGSTNGTTVSVSPSSTTVTNGGSATFTASPSSGSYTWSANPSSLGEIFPDGDSCTFKRNTTGSGTVTLTATDQDNRQGSATIN